VFGFYFLRDYGIVGLTLRDWVFIKTIILKTLLTAFVKRFLNNKKGCLYRGITSCSYPLKMRSIRIENYGGEGSL
jgi:hypothetical protein